MHTFSDQQRAANFMGALAHLLCGRPDGHSDFIDKVELILSGSEPHTMQLMQFNGQVRRSGRPVIWVHHSPDVPHVPQIGLVARSGEQVHVIENCMLWMAASDDRARLVPDGFNMGAFRFDDDLVLHRVDKAPSTSFERATPSMGRAYNRLLKLQIDQLERGAVFKLPEFAKAA